MLNPTQRKLTTHQKAVLVQVLRTFPDERVRICYSPSATDGRTYAEDFVSVFRAIVGTWTDQRRQMNHYGHHVG